MANRDPDSPHGDRPDAASADVPTASPAEASPHALPRQTTPTWEMELLISGLTVFALLQLPAVLDGWYAQAYTRIELEYGSLLMLFYVYSKAAVLSLAITFIAHLALRGYWVALIGMRSVYPDGIRWEKLRMGPHFRAVSDAMMRPMPELIERADNRATTVFAVGVGFAMVMIAPMFIVILSFVIALGLAWLLPAQQWTTLFYASCAVVMGPFMLSLLIDKLFGGRVREGTVLARAMRATMRVYSVSGLARTTSPLIAVFQSHVGARKGTMLLMVAMLAMFGLVFAQMMADLGALRVDNFRFLPRERAGVAESLRPEHYAATRPIGVSALMLPYIQAEIIKDPYVRLFVPYDPNRHNPALARDCPAAAVAADDDPAIESKRQRDLLDCVARLQPITLDGTAVRVPFDFARERLAGERGFVAMVPVRDLAPGRHELAIARIARPDAKPDAPNPPHVIVFWR